ncbi:MAG: ERF family protein [Actinobacteria bacterium]|nr:ERF family protein [Actinomycetota bacterium]
MLDPRSGYGVIKHSDGSVTWSSVERDPFDPPVTDVFVQARAYIEGIPRLQGSELESMTNKISRDLAKRDTEGRETYGAPLLTHNGRDWLVDTYEELLDALAYRALLEAKRNISPPAKNRKANYGRYADLEAILTAVEPPLADQGLVITQSVEVGEYGPVLTTRVVHAESGEHISSSVPLVYKNQNDPQQLGGSITYARRYGITALLSVVADDDDDGNTSSGKQKDGKPLPKPKTEPEGVTQEQIEGALRGGELPEKLVQALVTEYKRSGFEEAEIVPEVKALLERDFGQLSTLTEAEARTAAGHARKLKRGDVERLT